MTDDLGELARIAAAIAIAEGCKCEARVDVYRLENEDVVHIDVFHDRWCPHPGQHSARNN